MRQLNLILECLSLVLCLYIAIKVFFFLIIFIGTSTNSLSSMRDGWLVRQYEFFFTFVVVYGTVSTVCCNIPASSHIPSNCQDNLCCERRPFLRVTGSEVIFSSHLCPPLHSSNSCRGPSQPELDDTDFLLGQSVADTYSIHSLVFSP